MKLERAIEILTLMGAPDFEGHTEDILAARKLGIDALKRIQRQRADLLPYERRLLPRETWK